MSSKKSFTLDEALEYLDDVEVSDDFDSDNDESRSNFTSAMIYISPPVNPTEENSDVDSGDEESANVSNLTGKQLLASAALEMKCPNGKVVVGNHGENEVQPSLISTEGSKPQKRKIQQTAEPHVNKWKHTDMSQPIEFKWEIPNLQVHTSDSPVTLFEKFFSEEIIELICQETIRYVISKGKNNFQIDVDTLKAFLAVLLLSGYVELPRRPMFWENSEDTSNAVVTSLLSINRFDEIMQNLHLAENGNLDKNDKFAKVRPLLEKLNRQCLSNYQPEQTVSIDESMVPYFGRHGCKQYMRNKPVKFGYKFWVTAIPLEYAIQFYPYAGKDETYDSALGLGGTVANNLVSKLPVVADCNYHVITDNFFTSPSLLRRLKEKAIAGIGTVRANRTEKAPLKAVDMMEKLPRGSVDVVSDQISNVTFLRWRDNKVVTLASTFAGKLPLRIAYR